MSLATRALVSTMLSGRERAAKLVFLEEVSLELEELCLLEERIVVRVCDLIQKEKVPFPSLSY